jgi:hypothetical protein
MHHRQHVNRTMPIAPQRVFSDPARMTVPLRRRIPAEVGVEVTST